MPNEWWERVCITTFKRSQAVLHKPRKMPPQDTPATESGQGIDNPSSRPVRPPFIGLSSRISRMAPLSSPRLHPGFISELHDGRRTCEQRLPISRDAAAGTVRTKGFRMPALISRKPQRALAVTALVLAALVGGGIWLVQSGQSAAAPDVSIVKASRGDVVLSVGGVGRIVAGGVAAGGRHSGGRRELELGRGHDRLEWLGGGAGRRVRPRGRARPAVAREAGTARGGGAAARAARRQRGVVRGRPPGPARSRDRPHRAQPEAPQRSGEGHPADRGRGRRGARRRHLGARRPGPDGRPLARGRRCLRPRGCAARAGGSPDTASAARAPTAAARSRWPQIA